jgi:hypothetical protein
MNIDNQLLLGIVFITAGVAMGLLAYAAFLNRQQEGEEGLPEQPEGESLEEQMAEVEATETEEEETPPATPPEPIAEPEPFVGTEAATVPTSPATEADDGAAAETIVATPSTSPVAPGRPTVTVDRHPDTHRLMIKVDERVYYSMESLQESDDWPTVTDLFSDLLAWMIKADRDEQVEEEGESDETISQPASMVQQINMILGEKLSDRESGPRAVRLMEGVGGSIRVYIGVDSYSIEEVPDEEVKALIRQAVAEWEERQ